MHCILITFICHVLYGFCILFYLWNYTAYSGFFFNDVTEVINVTKHVAEGLQQWIQ